MLWLFLGVWLVTATLREGDNPYKILGVSKNAKKDEIKAAFRKLTMDLHPDRNKDKDTTAQWVQVNDAYELLSDPDRKVLFDRYGTVGDTLPSENPDNPFGDMNERFFQRQPHITVNAHTPLLTLDNHRDFLGSGAECLILVYSSVMCHECDIYLELFETFAKQYGSYCSCARIDCAKNADLAKAIGIQGITTIVYYRETENGVVTDYIPNMIQNVKAITNFLASHWNMNLYAIPDVSSFEAFLAHKEGTPKVLQLVRYGGATLSFMRLSHQLADQAMFAVVDANAIDCRDLFGVRTYPTYVVMRHTHVAPLVVSSTKAVREAIRDWARPTMVELTCYNFKNWCDRECLVRIGRASDEVIADVCQNNVSTFWMPAGTKAAEVLGCKEGDWVSLRTEEGVFAKIEGVEEGEWETVFRALNGLVYQQRLPENFNVDWNFRLFAERMVAKAMLVVRSVSGWMMEIGVGLLILGATAWTKVQEYLGKRREEKEREERRKAALSRYKEKSKNDEEEGGERQEVSE